ncbi:MAG: hypothetical protein JXA22_04765 [Candidatus Thermoplasmatota archaeon]|nr:hypothetical protein [Candidatus Thermoplasmatota archaeon]
MKSAFHISLIITGILLFLTSIFTSAYPFIFDEVDGKIDVNWTDPVGIRMNRLSKGDVIILEFRSEVNINLYLLTFEQAREYRSPVLYKEPLPQSLACGKEGKVNITIEKNGDYELLFIPGEPLTSFTYRVDYRMHVSLLREILLFLFSGMGLLLTSVIFIVLAIVLEKRKGNQVISK